MQELIPTSELVELRGAGHSLMVEAPTVYNRAVTDFLEKVSASPALVS